jgi:hypothetical protein
LEFVSLRAETFARGGQSNQVEQAVCRGGGSLSESAFLIPVVAILAGCAVAIVGTIARNRVRELEIRERIAMIEKGLVPPPEVDPRGFDRAMDEQDRQAYTARSRPSGRHRRGGVTLIGIGFGLMVLIIFVEGDVGNGIGVGGFLVIMGVAFLINGLFESREWRQMPPPPAPGPPPPRTTSPSDPL